jgi:hypothetical protein
MPKRRPWSYTYLVAAVAALGVLGGSGIAQATPVRRPAILSPVAGQHLRRGPVEIRVRTAGGRVITATLNGGSIMASLSPARRGVRTLSASPNFGLRFGRNVLRVRVRVGRRLWTRIARFRISSHAPLAAAGLDRVVAVGDHVVLTAAGSRLPRVRGLTGGPVRFRWSVVRPGGTRLARGLIGARQASAITDTGAATSTFTPTSVGSTTLRLNVTSPNGTTGTDYVDVRADPPPQVRVNTNATQGNARGISLQGPTPATSAFYPGDPSKWLQVVVLKRTDLSLVSNTSYDCPQAAAHPTPAEVSQVKPCQDQVKSDLAKLEDPDHSYLVIATSQGSGAGGQPPAGVPGALGDIGVAPWNWFDPNTPVAGGTFSAIGVPGLPKLDVEYPALTNQGAAASINDNLVRDNEGNYVLAPAEYPVLNTQAPGSDGSHNVIQLGSQRFDFPRPTNSHGGFEILSVDPRNLTGQMSWFELGNAGIPDQSLQDMTSTISDIDRSAAAPFGPGRIVIVTTRGSLDTAEADENISDDVLKSLTDQIETLGGTRGRFIDAVLHGHSYTLVGKANSVAGLGTEVTGPGAGTWGLNSVPLTGTLTRTGPYYTYQVQTADPFSTAGTADPSQGVTQLIQTAGQAPSQWPEQGNPGRTAAIAYVGTKVLGTPDPRSQYWTIPYDTKTWGDVSDAIKALPYPSGTLTGFTQDDLTWAQGELRQEISWLETVHSYVNALAKPFSDQSLGSWADLQKIANDINTKVGDAGDERIHMQTEALFDFLLDIGEEVPVIGKAVAAESKMYRAVMAQVYLQNEPALDDFPASVGEAGKLLADRLTAAQTQLTTQYANAIVSDYARLKTVGSCASVIASDWAGCPFDHSGWQYTQDDQRNAAVGLRDSAQVQAYGALLPAKYTAWTLPVNSRTTANDAFAGLLYFKCWYPFGASPASAQMAKPITPQVVSSRGTATYEITTLGYLTGQGLIGNDWVMHVPDASVTNPLFNTGTGNLGVNQEEFFDRFFPEQSRTRDWHYPERDTRTGWLPDCAPGSSARQRTLPSSLALSAARLQGISVGFRAPAPRSSVAVTWHLGNSRRANARPPKRSVLADQQVHNVSRGAHLIALRLSPASVRRVRSSGIHRTTLRITVRPPRGKSTTAFRTVTLRF